MYEIPMEGSAAGDTLVVVIILGPILAAVLGYIQKPRLSAFVRAAFPGIAIIAAGVAYAVRVAPGTGTWLLAGGLGGLGCLLCLLGAGVTVGARAIAAPDSAAPADARKAPEA